MGYTITIDSPYFFSSKLYDSVLRLPAILAGYVPIIGNWQPGNMGVLSIR